MAHIAENRWYLNGKDMFKVFGFVVSEGADTLLQPPERKEPYSNDWAERNGKEYDLEEAPKYKDRTISLNGFIVANGEADFFSKFNGLQAEFNKAGVQALNCVELSKTAYVFLIGVSYLKRHTKIKDTNKIVVSLQLELQEIW